MINNRRHFVCLLLMVSLSSFAFSHDIPESTNTQSTLQSTEAIVVDCIERQEGLNFVSPTDSFPAVYFPLNDSEIKESYQENTAALNTIKGYIHDILSNPFSEIRRITITGMASIEGKSAYNINLAERRALALKNYMQQEVALPDSVFEIVNGGIAWDMFNRQLEEAVFEGKEKVMRLINNTADPDRRQWLIRYLNEGKPYDFIRQHLLPQERNACVISIDVQHLHVETVERPTHVLFSQLPEMPAYLPPVTQEASTLKKPFYIAVKSNLLYDAALIPNLGVEFYLGKRWTLGVDWEHPWWYSDTHHRYWQSYGGYITLRKYFGKKAAEHPFTGQHVGLYAMGITYDVEFGGRGYQSARWNFGGGIEYGYSMPIARRLNLDFSIGVGYLTGKYKEYLPIDTHYVWQKTSNRHWVGPTKAEVSIVWLLGRGNSHARKGGNK